MATFEENAATAMQKLGLNGNNISVEEAKEMEANTSDSDDDLSSVEETDYQIGFIDDSLNALHHEEDWRKWDGGKVGGLPVWLNPVDLPPPNTLACSTCEEPMKFLLQIYCPLDDILNAFHRSIYLFCCKRAQCVSSGMVKVLRCQLPKANPYYAIEPSTDLEVLKKDSLKLPALCQLCGCLATNKCVKCKRASYCCRSHQKIHWKHHKAVCDPTGTTRDFSTDTVKQGWLFKEYNLAVCCEELVPDTAEAIESSTTIWEDARVEGKSDGATEASASASKEEEDDLALTQKDYDRALGNEERDPEYLRFLSRVRRSGSNQVLRYCRWDEENGPLPISTAAARDARENPPPSCARCGAECKFEFQVMPQLLAYLSVDKGTTVNNPTVEEARKAVAADAPPAQEKDLASIFRNRAGEDLDWGTIDVYTCSKSCCGESYAAEIARVTEVRMARA